MQFRVIVVTDPQTHTHRQDQLQYIAPQLAHSVKIRNNLSFWKLEIFEIVYFGCSKLYCYYVVVRRYQNVSICGF